MIRGGKRITTRRGDNKGKTEYKSNAEEKKRTYERQEYVEGQLLKKQVPCHCRESKPDSSVVQPVI
jgi:hypothetical protein